jgi:hypothetical protein
MNNDRKRHEMDDTRNLNRTITRSRTSTGEISNEEIDDDAMETQEEREHRGESSRGELGAGE